MNSTGVSYFTLAAYFDTGLLKYLFFIIVMSLYVLIICANVLLIVVICMNRSLHEPMYLFLCSLFVNELYGSTGLFPLLLMQILSDVHTVSVPMCLLQVFCIHCYGTVEYLILTAMSYDRYLAICCPLQYNTRMTTCMISKLLVAAWSYGVVTCGIMLAVTSSLPLCGNIIHKVYCDNYSVVKLSCPDTYIFNIYGLIISFGTIVFPLFVILYTYMKILKVCFSGCKQTRQKAVSTCTPHLASLLNFSLGVSFELLQSRFDMSHLPNMMRIFLSLYWLTFQLLLDPVMYGLNMTKIRIIFKSLAFAEL